MAQLQESKLAVVRQLIERASDAVVRSLEQALAGGGNYNDASEVLFEIVAAERKVRRAQGVVFAPVIAPFQRKERLLPTLQYPTDLLKCLWRELRQTDAELMERVVSAATNPHSDEPSPLLDETCELAASRLLDGAAPITAGRVATLPGGVEQLAQLLRLAPILRTIIPRLDNWLRNLNGDNVASVRLAFRDAAEICDDGGLLMMEILSAQIQEPWQVIRLISAVMDRPSDSYLAVSELAVFGMRVLADIDMRIEAVKRFDPSGGAEAGRAAAASITVTVHEISEFEQWITMSRETGWGKRLFEQKRNLATAIEARLKEADAAVGAALPVASKPFGAKSRRAPAKLTDDPSPMATQKALGLLHFMEGVRSSAPMGGFGSFRAKVIEALDERLDYYTEDLIDRLATDAGRRDGPPTARVLAFLDIAAQFIGLVRDPKAAEIIRRRSASATAA